MNILLWVLQVLAALLYGSSGIMTVLAATLLAIESLVFIGVHVKYSEITPMIMSGVLGLLMAFIAYGRTVLKPISNAS